MGIYLHISLLLALSLPWQSTTVFSTLYPVTETYDAEAILAQ